MTETELRNTRAAVASIEKDRARHLATLMGTGNVKRQRLYQEFGYPTHLHFHHFYNAYTRNAIAGAAVNRVVEGCWEDYPEVWEGADDKKADTSTAWDKAANKLLKRLWRQIKGADRRNCVGRYSALLLQLKDGKKWDQEVTPGSLSLLADKGLVRLIPCWETQIEPIQWQEDETADDYGFPIMYSFTELPVENNIHDAAPGRIVNVHASRVIILAEGSDDGHLTSGRSLLEDGFNKLLDIEKVSGGASEGFLKNASRQLNYSFSEKTDFAKLARALGTTEALLGDALDLQVRRLNDSTDSASIMQAGTAEVLSVAPADPEPTWRTAINEFCATIPIPLKVLVGMQTGERASSEDAADWARFRMSRRKGFLTDVLVELLTRLWTFGVLATPQQDEITVHWTDLLAPSQAEKIANMKVMADAALATSNAYGRAAFSENEVRAVGELEARSEPGMDDIDEKPKPEDQQQVDPLTGKPKQPAAGGPQSSQPGGRKVNDAPDSRK